MVYSPDILDIIEALPQQPWHRRVFRHMFKEYPPHRENTAGARWNPSGTAAIYTSLERNTALAEADYHISLQPVPLSVARSIYEIEVTLSRVVDLRLNNLLAKLGIDRTQLEDPLFERCQHVGGAVAWLGADGLLVPSARSAGSNLVVYPTDRDPDERFEVMGRELLTS